MGRRSLSSMPRRARPRGGVWRLLPAGRLRRPAMLALTVCAAGALLAAYMHTAPHEPKDFSGTPVPPPSETPPHIIALDAGHGGMDTGAQALMDEIDICNPTVDALFALLEADRHYTPVRTRPPAEDRSIAERAQAATEAGAELLLSIHANSDKSAPQAHGFECFPTPPGRTHAAGSMRFAQSIAAGMQAAGHRLRGETGIRFAYYNGKRKRIVDSTDDKVRSQQSFGVLEKAPCPAVLVEQCFLTNGADVENWGGADGCARAARIYYEAICAYFGTEPAPAR